VKKKIKVEKKKIKVIKRINIVKKKNQCCEKKINVANKKNQCCILYKNTHLNSIIPQKHPFSHQKHPKTPFSTQKHPFSHQKHPF
jgi:hypothetical protein